MLGENPASELNNLCMRLGLRIEYEFADEQDGSSKRVLLVLTPKDEDSQNETRRFEGTGANKKEARKNVSQHALSKLTEEGLNVPMEQPSIEEAVLLSLSPERMKKDPVLRCYFYMALKRTIEWVPLSLLVASKTLKGWAKREGLDDRESVRDMTTQVAQRLCQESLSKLAVSDDGLLIRPIEPIEFPEDMEERLVSDNTEKECWNAVLLKAQTPVLPIGVFLRTEVPLLESILQLLKSDIRHLATILTPCNRSIFVPSLQNAEEQLAVDVEKEDVFEDALNMKLIQRREIRPPSVWFHNHPDATLNVAASWLLGMRIYGDALLTLTRPSRIGNDSLISMRWRDFSVSDFWSRVLSLDPEQLCTSDLGIPILGRLPKQFVSQGEWQGHLPQHLLKRYVHTTSQTLEASEIAIGDPAVRLRIAERGLEIVEVGDDPTAVYQNASLKLLESIRLADQTLWIAQPSGWISVHQESVRTSQISPGNRYKSRVLEGSKIRLTYRLFIQNSGWFLIESCNDLIHHVSNTSVLDVTVMNLHLYGSNRTHFSAEAFVLNKTDAMEQRYEFCLFVRVMAFIGEQNQVKLFDPPMSMQRFQAVSAALIKHNCRSVLDIGCGEGRFLDHLAYNYGNRFSVIHGIDISTSGLRRAVVRMKQQKSDFMPRAVLSYGNVLDGSVTSWKQDIDAVVMIEVLEHLDPEPLSHIGSTILGIMHPRVFIATTPNWEYNRILYHIGGAPNTERRGRDGTSLRCSDHRFEWIREEFKAWAHDLSGKYGYDVVFVDIGMMIMEPLAREELKLQDVDLGRSSQMAVFTRRAESINACYNLIPPEYAYSKLQLLWTNGTVFGEREGRRTI